MAKNIDKIKRLEALHLDLMEQYYQIVNPYGLGYSMPKDKSERATEVMNHAKNVRKEVEQLRKKAGLKVRQPDTSSNARPAISATMEEGLRKISFGALLKKMGILTRTPALFYEFMYMTCAMKFITYAEEVEPNDKSIRLIADTRHYRAFFQKLYKDVLITIVGLLNNKMLMRHYEAVQDEIMRLTTTDKNVRTYFEFKQKFFGSNGKLQA